MRASTASVPSAWIVPSEHSYATSPGSPVTFGVACTPVVASVAWVAKVAVDTMALLVVRLASAERTSFIAFELKT